MVPRTLCPTGGGLRVARAGGLGRRALPQPVGRAAARPHHTPRWGRAAAPPGWRWAPGVLDVYHRDGGPQRRRPVRVLVVDDSPLVREGLTALLDAEPDLVVVGACTDGDEVVEAAEQLRPDVVLMDLLMPNVDGLTATRQLLAARPGTRVVVLTGDALAGRRAALDAGAVAYVRKRGNSADLLDRIRAAGHQR